LDTQFIEDYEFTAEDVLASGGGNNGSGSGSGEGSARIRIRYVPQGMGNQNNMAYQQGADGTGQGADSSSKEDLEETGISINPFGELNALIIRYTNPALYQDAVNLITQLDQPTKQVEIETKFVEVNETRAKEFSADFNITGLTSGRNIDWDNNLVNSRYAQDQDEFRDAFSPPIENPANANLIKGTTILGATIGSVPMIQYNLRLLEAEGIINITNGPKVMALDGQDAEFRIEQYAPRNATTTAQNPTTGIVNPLDQALNLELADIDEATNQSMITAVVLRMTPEITSENSIILNDLSAELIDFEGWLGEAVSPVVTQVVNNANNRSPINPVIPGVAVTNANMQMLMKRKKIVTVARIQNGGTIVIGGWTGERTQELTSGIPVLRNMPYFGKLLFSRAQRTSDRTTLLIFLTGYLVD
jgi:type II secretory pathway component GspD/PulD (secretin)